MVQIVYLNGGMGMRKSFEPRAWLYPEPVLVIGTYNEDGTANAMVAAWGAMSDFKQIFIEP